MIFKRTSQQALFGTSALLFAGSAALTATLCASMSDMGGMPMPGGWTMSMAWIPMPGQTWLGAAGSFVGVCAVMMVSMMLPVAGAHAVAVSPDDWRFRQNTPELADGAGGRRILCCLVLVWNCRIPFRCGACRDRDATAHAGESRSHGCGCGRRARRHAAIQRVESASPCLLPEPFVHEHRLPANASTAWRQGLRLSFQCTSGCAGFTAILLVLGVMDLRVMALVTAAITAKRLVVVGVGLLLVAGAAGLG